MAILGLLQESLQLSFLTYATSCYRSVVLTVELFLTLPGRGRLYFWCVMSGEAATGTWWVDTSEAVNHPAMHNKDLSGPKCPQGQGWKTLPVAFCFHWATPGSPTPCVLGRKFSPGGSTTGEPHCLILIPFVTHRIAPALQHTHRKPVLLFALTGSICSCWGNHLKKSVPTMLVNNFYSILVISLCLSKSILILVKLASSASSHGSVRKRRLLQIQLVFSKSGQDQHTRIH